MAVGKKKRKRSITEKTEAETGADEGRQKKFIPPEAKLLLVPSQGVPPRKAHWGSRERSAIQPHMGKHSRERGSKQTEEQSNGKQTAKE